MIKKWINKNNTVAIVLLFFLTLLFFYKIFLHPNQMIYPAYDLGIYSAWKTFFVKSFYEYGRLPLWNPYLFSGATFVGSGQSAMFYPLNILYLFFSVEKTFGYIFALDFFLIGLFTYLYCRVIKLSRFSSIVSAICFEFNGTIILKLFSGHIFIVDGIVWFPLILLFFELALQHNRLAYGLFAGIPLALMFLSGNAQIAVYGYMAAGIYFIIRYFTDYILGKKNYQISKVLLTPIITLLVGLSLSAIQLIPSHELSKLSIRANGLDLAFSSSFLLSPKQLIGFILPHLFGSPLNSTYWGKGNFESNTGYFGIFPLILAFISTRFLFKNKYIIPFTFLILFSLFFSFGNSSFLYPLFHNYIPGFNLFRVPSRFLFVYAFSIAILAGIGTQYIYNKHIIKKIRVLLKKLTFILIFCLGTLFIFIIFILISKDSFLYYQKYVLKNSYAVGINHKILFTQTVNDLYSLTISIAISILIILLIIKTRIPVQLSKTFIVVFIFLNLFLFGSRFYDTKNPTDVFKNPKEINQIVKSNKKFRVFDLSGSFVFFLPRNYIQSVTGYDAIYLKDYRDFLWKAGIHENSPFESFFQFHSVDNPMILKLLNTKYVLSKNPLRNPDLKLFYKDLHYVYELKDFLPRAYIVGNGIIIANRRKLLNEIIKDKFNYKETVIFEKQTNFPLKNNSAFMSIPIKNYTPDKITLSTKLENPAYLVLSEIWYPGWKAYLNGKETEIYKANYIFRSIYLNKGKNYITFIYDPKSYKNGKNITIISGFFILCLILLELINYNKNRSRK